MASQKELVAVVADKMRVPLETVTVVDRFLAEAGLRTRALRGRANTQMTYVDAANLIIATALGSAPKDAVRQVVEYGQLHATRVREDASIADDALGATFGEALANVIESVAASREEFSAHEDSPKHMAMTVRMYGPDARAEIRLVRAGVPTTFLFGPMYGQSGDLQRIAEFSQLTLGFVGEAIAAGLST
ncbi:MAG: hypothetical protein EON58_20050 [Alphaproteobacteria bacterium]|nr:MAG: hypothetical protein EON58_20050 [Alphaproteobacteria bacterium]